MRGKAEYVYIYVSVFDLCTFAGQSLEMGYFDASVAFYSFCLSKMKQDELYNNKIVGIFKKKYLSSLTSGNVQNLLDKAMDAHDLALDNDGQLGLIHRCQSQPFRRRKGMAGINFHGKSGCP